jgi:DNA-binding MarR family transcriptional regulator
MSAAPGPGPDPARLAAWRRFLQAHSRIVERLEAELEAGARLPLSWYDVLVQLDEAPAGCLRIQELGRALAMSGSGLSRRVSRMAEASLVTRRPCDDDRRGVLVTLTPAGERALRAVAPLHLDGIQRLFARHLSEADAQVLRAAFDRMLCSLDDGPLRTDTT